MTVEDIPIRSIQHWLYCPHRWGLLEIDCAWSENYYVTKANLLHRRVHDAGSYTARGKRSFTSVTVYNDLPQYRIYGVTDCLEQTDGGYAIVEYKPTKPKNAPYHQEDLLQVFAQKLCVDYVFGGDCEGYLYYADVKKRVRLPLNENYAEYNNALLAALEQMRACLREGRIPPVPVKQKCGGCSMRDICMPGKRRKMSLRTSIENILEGT